MRKNVLIQKKKHEIVGTKGGIVIRFITIFIWIKFSVTII